MAFRANMFAFDKDKRCIEQGGHFPGGANVVRPTAALRSVDQRFGEGDNALEWWTVCTNCGTRYRLPNRDIMVVPPQEPEEE